MAARRAIASGDVRLVLPWIAATQAAAIRAAFQETLAARKLGGPAGAIRVADRALESGQLTALENELTSALREGLRERFARVMATKEYAPGDVEGGRKHVAAYVAFIHFAERMQEAAAAGQHEH